MENVEREADEAVLTTSPATTLVGDRLADGGALDEVRRLLLLGKTWRYLRYIHARDSFSRVASDVKSVVVAGGGHALAEVALALEFPDTVFTVTDLIDKSRGYPNYQMAQALSWKFGIRNIHFSVWNVLQHTKNRFDMVMSTEMLEHIEQDELAAAMIRKVATKFIYCLVPFADKTTNEDPARQRRAWTRNEHYRVGYDADRLVELFGTPHHIRGAYWSDAGLPFRQRLTDMTNEEIKSRSRELYAKAQGDLIDRVPTLAAEAMGIRILAKKSGV